jgi:hypothetical protein
MDLIDVREWNQKVEKAFTEAKESLPRYEKELGTICDVLSKNLTEEERIVLEKRRKELCDLIDDLINDTSFGFYLLEVQKFLEASPEIPVVSFMKKAKGTNKGQEQTKAFLTLVEKYNRILNLDLPKIGQSKKPTVCTICGNSKDFDVVDSRVYYCSKCGVQIKENFGTKSTYKDVDRVNISSKYKYTRMIHFHNCVRQYQGKQKAKIQPQVCRDVEEQLALNGIRKNVTPQHIRSALQETGWISHYENCILIWSLITKKSCPDISDLEEKIYQDFELVEREYNKIIDGPEEERSSFMSYPYVLFQLLRRHGHKCNREFFNMLKEDRIIWLDEIMEKIYERLEWPSFTRLSS